MENKELKEIIVLLKESNKKLDMNLRYFMHHLKLEDELMRKTQFIYQDMVAFMTRETLWQKIKRKLFFFKRVNTANGSK